MDRKVIELLISASKRAQQTPGMRMNVEPDGIMVVYQWGPGPRHLMNVLVSWEALENASDNPLLTNMTSLTKKAGALQ